MICRQVLIITADILPNWHVYSLTQPAGGPQTTTIELTPSDQYRVAGSFTSQPAPTKHFEQVFNMEVEEHENKVTWYLPIELAEGVEPASLRVNGVVHLQACEESATGRCVPLDLAFTAKLGEGAAMGPLDFTNNGPQPVGAAVTPAPANGQAASDAAYKLEAIRFDEPEGSLAGNLLLAFFGGLLLNLMPCVLPVIGLKVMSFVEQAGHSRSQALKLNLWYSAGIISVFLVLAALAITAGLGWGDQFGSATFNIVMASIVFAMALSLLGVWEIPIPGFIGSGSAQEAAAQEGPLGAFLKGVITTILATPCTGPGMAVALGWAISQPAATTLAVFFALGIGMASPYLVIGAFPSLIRFLPKPGAWMVTFKQLMGFVLIATVVFLLSVLPSENTRAHARLVGRHRVGLLGLRANTSDGVLVRQNPNLRALFCNRCWRRGARLWLSQARGF